jgi:hypothetical protein
MAGTWSEFVSQPPHVPCGALLLLTDGSVMYNGESTAEWWRLRPDSEGNYATGSWTQVATMANARAFFPAAVLADGRLFVAGGEYSAPYGNPQPPLQENDLAAAEIYDPIANTWTNLSIPECPGTPPSPWLYIGDVPCCVLPDGQLLIGCLDHGDYSGCPTSTALFDPTTDTWTTAASKTVPSGEETWTLLPDGSVLTVDPYAAGSGLHPAPSPNLAVKYLPGSNEWVSAGSLPAGSDIVQEEQPGWQEIGPAVTMPDGSVFAIGANGNTAIYRAGATPETAGTWTAGPKFPTYALTHEGGPRYGAADAPCCLMPNGKVLCVVGKQIPPNTGPAAFFEYDPSGTPLELEGVPTAPTLAGLAAGENITAYARLLVLPNGQVMFGHKFAAPALYTPDGTPLADCAPVVESVEPTVIQLQGGTYQLTGVRLHGVSQACSYGDDATNATNYPIVRLHTPHGVVYCRTHGHSTMGIVKAGDTTTSTTYFDVPSLGPPTFPPLTSVVLTVVVNGIASAPVTVRVA